jgi:hypothetical protein
MMPGLGELIDQYIRSQHPEATVYVGVFHAVSRAVVGVSESLLYVSGGPFSRTFFAVESPYVVDTLGNSVPLGIRYVVASAAPDVETATRYFVTEIGRLHTMTQLSANAPAFPIRLRLMYVHAPGDVMFRELLHEPEIAHPINSRLIDSDATLALYSTARGTQEQRLERAAVQYELALRRYQSWERPIALGHLYMGVEALTKAMIRYECDRLNKSEVELAGDYGIDANDSKLGHKLEVFIRRDVIFQGDADTYNAARKASDGLEHGYADWEEIWKVPEAVFPRAATLFREAILRALKLPENAFKRLVAAPFDSYVEQGAPIAFEASAPVTEIDLRATDFKIANVQRVQIGSSFDEARGEYSFTYRLEAGPKLG